MAKYVPCPSQPRSPLPVVRVEYMHHDRLYFYDRRYFVLRPIRLGDQHNGIKIKRGVVCLLVNVCKYAY